MKIGNLYLIKTDYYMAVVVPQRANSEQDNMYTCKILTGEATDGDLYSRKRAETAVSDFSIEDVLFDFEEAYDSKKYKDIRFPRNRDLPDNMIKHCLSKSLPLLDPFEYDKALICIDEDGVFYDFYEALDITADLNSEHEAQDVLINGIISSVEYSGIDMYFVQDEHTGSYEDDPVVKVINGKEWFTY